MKSVTYNTDNGPVTLEYDENYPCIWCQLPVGDASMGGTVVCPACDCGINRDGTKWSYADYLRLSENARKWYAEHPPKVQHE